METCPDEYKDISRGLAEVKLSCYPDNKVLYKHIVESKVEGTI